MKHRAKSKASTRRADEDSASESEMDPDSGEIPIEAAVDDEDDAARTEDDASPTKDDVPRAKDDAEGADDAEDADETDDGGLEEDDAVDEEPIAPAPASATSTEERQPFMTTSDSPFVMESVARGSIEEIIVIPDDDRRTSHIMSMSEYTEAISIRTAQIAEDGAQGTMLDSIPPHLTCARDIAIAEMQARRCPLKLARHVGRTEGVGGAGAKNYVEIWSPNLMTHPPFQ